MTNTIAFNVAGAGECRIAIHEAIIAGWTGRDAAALEKHIKELEELGVARPASTPIFYRVAAARLTTAPAIEVIGEASSGEVEFVLVREGGKLFVGVGSDHTDRQAETVGVTLSKQMCDKPLAPQLWAFDEVAPHWDKLELRSWIIENGAHVLYQEGGVTAMRAPDDLMGRYTSDGLPNGAAMFCGTLAAKGGIRPSSRFEFELRDPVLNRAIKHGYDIRTLHVAG